MTTEDQRIEEATIKLKEAVNELGELNVRVHTLMGSGEEGETFASLTNVGSIGEMLKMVNRAKNHLEIEQKKIWAQNN